MISIAKKLQEMADTELFALCEAVDLEIQRRDAMVDGDVPDSARRRAVKREQSYRRQTGALAPPVRTVGLGRTRRDAA